MIENCPDCKGVGAITLLFSRVDCERCAHAVEASAAVTKVDMSVQESIRGNHTAIAVEPQCSCPGFHDTRITQHFNHRSGCALGTLEDTVDTEDRARLFGAGMLFQGTLPGASATVAEHIREEFAKRCRETLDRAEARSITHHRKLAAAHGCACKRCEIEVAIDEGLDRAAKTLVARQYLETDAEFRKRALCRLAQVGG